MASEIRVSGSLSVQKRSGSSTLIDYSRPFAFTATLDGNSGPYIGTVRVPVTGVSIDLATEIGEQPGVARIVNQDPTNFVMVGIYDGASFLPLLEVLPTEAYALRFYRGLGEEFVGTGSTFGSNTLWLQADTDEVAVLLEVFPR